MRALVFTLLSGCARLPSAADVERAGAIVTDVYRLTPEQAPPLDARPNTECENAYGNAGLQLSTGACVPGFTDDRGCHFLIGPVPLSETELAHEAHHWTVWQRAGAGSASMDPEHLDPTWGWEVTAANSTLRDAGL